MIRPDLNRRLFYQTLRYNAGITLSHWATEQINQNADIVPCIVFRGDLNIVYIAANYCVGRLWESFTNFIT